MIRIITIVFMLAATVGCDTLPFSSKPSIAPAPPCWECKPNKAGTFDCGPCSEL